MEIATETEVLARMMRSLSGALSADLARALVNLRVDQETQARFDELASKNSAGQLTTEEGRELEAVVRANTFLGILKAQSLASLDSPSSSSSSSSSR